MLIRDQEIMLPTSMVGNYPNPRWWDANFARFFTGDQHPPDSLEREALEDVISALAHDQESAGLDIISDGRVQGDNYADQAVYYYYKRMGYDLKGGYLGFPIYSRLHAATLTQEVKRRGAIMVEQAKALNEDILEVDALGVDFIQLDEFTWPYGFEDWAIEAFNRAVEGVKHAKIVCHICWGNWGGTPAYLSDQTAQAGEIFDLTQRKGPTPGDSTFVIPTAYQAKMDVLNLETSGRRRDLSGLGTVLAQHPLPKNLQFWAGVIDVKSTITETAAEVADRIRQILQYVPADQLGLTTDCGLILLQRYIAIDKLHALAAGAQLVRSELARTPAGVS